MGGYISLAFAEKYKNKLTGLGLFHSSAYADDATKIETRRKGIEFIKTNGPLAFLKTSIPGLFADTEKSKAEINLLIDRAKTFSGESKNIFRRSIDTILRSHDCPDRQNPCFKRMFLPGTVHNGQAR